MGKEPPLAQHPPSPHPAASGCCFHIHGLSPEGPQLCSSQQDCRDILVSPMPPDAAVVKNSFPWGEPAQNWPLLQQPGQRDQTESDVLVEIFVLKSLGQTFGGL